MSLSRVRSLSRASRTWRFVFSSCRVRYARYWSSRLRYSLRPLARNEQKGSGSRIVVLLVDH